MAVNISPSPSMVAFHLLGPHYRQEHDAARRFFKSGAKPDEINQYLLELWDQKSRWNRGFNAGRTWSPINLTSEEKEICAKAMASFHPEAAAAIRIDQVAWRTFYEIGLCVCDPNFEPEVGAYIKKWRGRLFPIYRALFRQSDTEVKMTLILRRIYRSKSGEKKVYKALDMNSGQYKAVTMWPESPKSRKELHIPQALETEKCPYLAAPYESSIVISKYKKGHDKDGYKLIGISRFYTGTYAEKPPKMKEQVCVMLAVLKGTKYLHDKGYAHRDIKPSNIFRSPEGAKLGDYGLVCPLGEFKYAGTRDYASPETFRGQDGVTTKCAVWEIGVTGLELMGYPIGDKEHINFKRKDLLTDDRVSETLEGWKKVRKIKEPVTQLDHDLFQIYRSCLRVNPDERPSIEELIAEFEKLTQPEAQPPSAAKAAEG